MKIAVTGSNGFLGTYFKEFTTLKQEDIYYLTTSNSVNNQLLCKPLYENISDVLSDTKIDVIIHFASVLPSSFEDAGYELFLKNNQMMKNIYDFSLKSHLNKFVYLSGFGSMNDPKLLDIKDYYTMSKITGEHFCAMMESNGIETASLRISAPYGEYAKAKTVINLFIEKAIKNETIEIFGSGKREQNFTYAGDIVKAIELSLKHKISGVYNIVSEKNINMLELAKLIVKLTNSYSKIVSNETIDPQEHYLPNYEYSKASIQLGYKPIFNIEEGLKRYIEWILK